MGRRSQGQASLQPRNPVLVHGREFGAQIELVEARRVVAEDRALDSAVGGSDRSKTILLPHVLWDLEAAECLNLPLGRTVPHRVRAQPARRISLGAAVATTR